MVLASPSAFSAPLGRAVKRQAQERVNEVTRKLGLSDQGQNSVVFGGPRSGALLLEGTLGYSHLPRLGVHYGLTDSVSVGGAFAFNLGYYSFAATFPNIQFSVPILITFSRQKMVGGVRIEPGIAMVFALGQVAPMMTVDLEANAGVRLGDIAKLGGGINIPFGLVITAVGAAAFVPILFGPVFEIAPTPEVAFHVDVKLGPYISSAGGVFFGSRLAAGITYAF